METHERLVLDDHVGNGYGLSDSFVADFAVPFARYLVPGQAIFELFKHDPNHNARPPECRLSSADLRVSHNVPPQFDPVTQLVRARFHTVCPKCARADFHLQAVEFSRAV
jgi:hypothetical protein